jgi:hypothetical protein
MRRARDACIVSPNAKAIAMSRDRREEILARLLEIIDAVDGIRKGYRNLDDIAGIARPCARMFDGAEGLNENPASSGEHRGGGGHVLTMRPPIGIAMSSAPEKIGTDLNAMRLKFIKAVTSDTVLLSICGRNGRIRYEGCEPETSAGRAVNGEMFLTFAISYPLIPAEL